jgi:hypothetical protein
MHCANKAEIVLNATPEQVWQKMTDLKSFPDWNPMTPSMVGECVEGAAIKGKIQMGPMQVPFPFKVTTVRPGDELRWEGGYRGLMYLDHRFILEDKGDGTTLLRHHEEFTGLAATGGMLANAANDVHASFDAALKQQLESIA